MKVSKLLVAAIASVATAATAHAQTVQNCTGAAATIAAGSCTVATNVSVTVPAVARMTFSTVATNLTAPTAAQFGAAAPGVTTAGPSIDVNANVAYTLKVDAATPNFAGPAGTSKPSSSLTYSVDGGTDRALGTTVGSTGAASATATYAIQYRTKYDWTVDLPGTYTLGLTYTLTAP